jgi:hypothetical protein
LVADGFHPGGLPAFPGARLAHLAAGRGSERAPVLGKLLVTPIAKRDNAMSQQINTREPVEEATSCRARLKARRLSKPRATSRRRSMSTPGAHRSAFARLFSIDS